MRRAHGTVILGLLCLALCCIGDAGTLRAQTDDHAGHSHGPAMTGPASALPTDLADRAGRLIVQDYQGRMKPLDTLAREMVRKTTKSFAHEGWDPLQMYLNWLARPSYWFDQPLIYVRYPGLKDLLGVEAGVKHVSGRSLVDDQGNYRLAGVVEEALRTPDRDRTKTQRKLLTFDERFNLLVATLQGRTAKVFPVPGDANHKWVAGDEIDQSIAAGSVARFREVQDQLFAGLRSGDAAQISQGVQGVRLLQHEFGSEVLPGPTPLGAELLLNRVDPFKLVLWSYFAASALLLIAYGWTLARRGGQPYTWRHPLFSIGMMLYVASLLVQMAGYTLRWIASGRAPLSNGYESLLFISLAVALAGLLFELPDRRGSSAGLGALLTFVVLGISMASHFDPAIGPLVPVLNSSWLTIHVTVITASYGFLGQGALIGGLMLLIFLFRGPGRGQQHRALTRLHHTLGKVLIYGVGLLTVGTLLGGVWANESWGRYWGWDPKETWSLITILVYTVVLHCRWVPALNRPWLLAAGAFAAISSVVMTYFGVNYFLSGLHSYASGETISVPAWVYIGAAIMALLILSSGLVEARRRQAISPDPIEKGAD